MASAVFSRETEFSDDDSENDKHTMKAKIMSLQTENEKLKKILKETNDKTWSQKIDIMVDKWYDKYNDDIDIGRISVFEILGKKYEIDVLPDEMEKAIYKKCVKIMFSILHESVQL